MVALAQELPPDDVQGPVFSGTVIPTADAVATDVPPPDKPDTTSPPASAIETALAGFITAMPPLIVFSVLVALIAYLIRERIEVTRLLAKGMSEDMAKSLVDTFIKGVFSIAGSLNGVLPGDVDDRVIDGLAKDAGLQRTKLADGKYGPWQPIPGFLFPAAKLTETQPFTGMERVALGDGSYAYKPGSAATGVPRTIHPDGSYTLDDVSTSSAGEHSHPLRPGPGNPYAVTGS